MSIRFKLLATVAIPMLSASVLAQPVLAETAAKPLLLAQDSGEQILEQPQAEPQEQPAEEPARPSRKQRKKQAEEEAAPSAAPQAEEQQPQAEEPSRPSRKQRKAQTGEEAAPQREEPAAEPQAEEPQTRKQRRKTPAQAEEPGRTEERPAREAVEPQQAPQGEAAPRSDEQPREQRKREGKKTRRAEENRQPVDEQARPETEQPQAEEPKAREQGGESGEAKERVKPSRKPDRKAPSATESEETPAREPEAAKPGQPRTDEKPAEEKPKTDGMATEPHQDEPEPAQPNAPQRGDAPQRPEGQPRAEEGQTRPVPAIVDERTPEQRQEMAKDPSTTDETVVLPVENGAAVLDSDKDADNAGGNRSREERRKLREKQRSAEQAGPPPTDDAAAQTAIPEKMRADLPQRIEANLKEKGTRLDEAPAFALPETTNIVNNTVINNTTVNNTMVNEAPQIRVVERVDDRIVLGEGDRIFVRGDDRPRLRRDAQESYYEELPRGRTRETIVRPGGYQIVTVYDRYGNVVQRSRIGSDGDETLMIYAPEDEDTPRAAMMDVGDELPPMRLTVPVSDYIVDVTEDPDRDFYEFLAQPPVERVERVYTIDEVRHSARLRDKVRRIDLDTIHFATASAEISLSQAKTLRKVADAIQKALSQDPGETFFIEGHTDAVGSDRSNLVLSDQRAESVANILSEVYDIPPENLVTQGYGERFLKIRTQEAEEENRRVTIRRVTPLVRPVAQR